MRRICAWCGRWKDLKEPARWHPAETLTVDTSAASHGMCPDCRKEHTAADSKAFRRRRDEDGPGGMVDRR